MSINWWNISTQIEKDKQDRIAGEAPAAQAEINDIMHNSQNPKHARWLKGDPEVQAYMENLWKRTTGGE
jgi:hypothetical protein